MDISSSQIEQPKVESHEEVTGLIRRIDPGNCDGHIQFSN